MAKKVAVLGAGNGGCAFAGHLATKGFEVGLYEDPKFGVEGIKEAGGIELSGKFEGFGRLSKVSTDIGEVMLGADVVMVVVPAFAQSIIMERALPHLEDGQVVVFNPDNFASLVFRKMLNSEGVKKDIKIAGTASLLYACVKISPTNVEIHYVKDVMFVAALPATDNDVVVQSLRNIYSSLVPQGNVLEVSFGNINQILHCPAAVLNAGRIEDTKGDFMFYWEGMTESVCRVMQTMDEEKIRVAEKVGFKLMSTHDYLKHFYQSEKPGIDLHDFVTHSRAHGGRGPDAPKDLHYRYVSEDVPYGLVPISLFAEEVDVPTPAIDSIITLASILNETDYLEEGRSMEELGLSGKSCTEILELIERGGR